VEASDAVLEDFLPADLVVVGAPMYNFVIPSLLKNSMHHLAVPDKTFRYTSEGPVGLAGGKKMIVALWRGASTGRRADARRSIFRSPTYA
jgi:FMN-dependent NADH-azoreductase